MKHPLMASLKSFARTTRTCGFVGLVALVGLAPQGAAAVDAESVIRRALTAIGGADVKTISFTGAGSGGLVGQAYEPNLVWSKQILFHDDEDARLRERGL